MRLAMRAKILNILLALAVAGFALWWYYKPFPLMGAIMAVLSGSFTYFILNTKRKERFLRVLKLG